MIAAASGSRRRVARGRVAGVVAAVPRRTVTNDNLGPAAAEASRMTGVMARRIAPLGTSTEDLCLAAAARLMVAVDWAPDTIDTLIYVTQTPGLSVPSSAYSLHAALGLPRHCAVIEVNWSCAGFVYGLWLAMSLAPPDSRTLLLVGDTVSGIVEPGDRATAPLFGDAGSATAIAGGGDSHAFVLGSDGAGVPHLQQTPRDWLRMNGAEVFNFTLRTVPALISDVLACGRVDWLLFHQANRFMLQHLVKKAGLLTTYRPAQIPSNIDRYGNTSCASIPLLLCDAIGTQPAAQTLALFGYGAGWAWAGASISLRAGVPAVLIEV